MAVDRFVNPFESEEDLCTSFAEHARLMGWKVYPETSNWDLLLVASENVRTRHARPGDQIGVQAKMKDNVEVLSQALPKIHSRRGPNYHAVLVPRATPNFITLANELMIHVFTGTQRKYVRGQNRYVRGFERELHFMHVQQRLVFSEPAWFPEVEVWTPAGVPAPSSITPWKMKAVRLCVIGRRKGFITSADFYTEKVSMTTWVRQGWVTPVEGDEKYGKLKKYRVADVAPDTIYPEIAEAVRNAEKQVA